MNENEKLYHSALSRCADLLDNMSDGDPITMTPVFLAAKLMQMKSAGAARQGGNTSEELLGAIARGWCAPENAGKEMDSDLAFAIGREVAAHLARQSQAQPNSSSNSSNSSAGQSQATKVQAVPEGWKLVPVEPTLEMLDRGHHQIDFDRNGQNTEQLNHPSQTNPDGAATSVEQDMRDAWAAMLATAPQAPTAQEVTQQAAPEVPLWDDNGEPWNEAAEKVERERLTQQAAKAETAEPATADDIAQLPGLMDEWANAPRGKAARAVYARIVKCIDSHFLAPTTSTVSAAGLQLDCSVCSGYGHYGDGRDAQKCHACNGTGKVDAPVSTVSASDEIRNAALEEAASECLRHADTNPHYVSACCDCADAIRQLRTTSPNKGEAA